MPSWSTRQYIFLQGPLTRTEELLMKSEQGIHRAEPLCQPLQYILPRHCLREPYLVQGHELRRTLSAPSNGISCQTLLLSQSPCPKPCSRSNQCLSVNGDAVLEHTSTYLSSDAINKNRRASDQIRAGHPSG